MKTVAIITIHYGANHGSVLQTYATQCLFEQLGYNAYVINYERMNYNFASIKAGTEEKYKSLLGPVLSKVLMPVLMWRWYQVYKKSNAKADAFRQKYIHWSKKYDDVETLFSDPPEADIYCTGSDQIWNSLYNGGVLPEYFLDFAPPGKPRIAFSASIGRTDLDDAELAEMKPYVKKYKAISVRESAALDIIKQTGYEGAVHVLDPTLCIDGNTWKKTFAIEPILRKPYVLLYYRSWDVGIFKLAKRIGKESGVDVIRIGGGLRPKLYVPKTIECPSPVEWISLFANATCVVTNSFHGTAFSLNLNRNFFVRYPSKYSSRLQSLLKLTGTEHRVIQNDGADWKMIAPIDFSRVNTVFEQERQRAKLFLVDALKDE